MVHYSYLTTRNVHILRTHFRQVNHFRLKIVKKRNQFFYELLSKDDETRADFAGASSFRKKIFVKKCQVKQIPNNGEFLSSEDDKREKMQMHP